MVEHKKHSKSKVLSVRGNHANKATYRVIDIKNEPLPLKDEDEGGEGVSTAGIDIEDIAAWYAAMLKRQIRQGEKKFGAVPDTEDPSLMGRRKGLTHEFGERAKMHPLFRDSSHFSGIDNKHNPSPSENPKSADELQKRLENRAQNRFTKNARKTINFSRY